MCVFLSICFCLCVSRRLRVSERCSLLAAAGCSPLLAAARCCCSPPLLAGVRFLSSSVFVTCLCLSFYCTSLLLYSTSTLFILPCSHLLIYQALSVCVCVCVCVCLSICFCLCVYRRLRVSERCSLLLAARCCSLLAAARCSLLLAARCCSLLLAARRCWLLLASCLPLSLSLVFFCRCIVLLY